MSTRLGQNVVLLTYVTIFYLPLAFCAVSLSILRKLAAIILSMGIVLTSVFRLKALRAIPDIADSGTRNPLIITAVMVGLATYVTVYNLENILGVLGRAYQALGYFEGKPTYNKPVEPAEV